MTTAGRARGIRRCAQNATSREIADLRVPGKGSAVALFAGALLLAVWTGEAHAATVRVLGPGQGIPPGPVSSLLVANGRLYVGTLEKGLVTYDLGTGRTKRVTKEDGLPSGRIRSLAFFQGKVHAGTSEGIAVEEGAGWSVITEAGKVRFRNVVLAVSPDGRELWVSSVHLAGGSVRFDGKTWTFVGGEGRGLFNEVNSFGFFPGGVLMGAMSGAVYVVKDSRIESLAEGFPPANVMAVGERGGTVYAGTNRGLFLWRGNGWGPAQVPPPFAGTPVFSILRSDIDLLVGGREGLLLLDRKGEARILSGTGNFPRGAVTALAEEDGTVYAATEGGVAVVGGWRE